MYSSKVFLVSCVLCSWYSYTKSFLEVYEYSNQNNVVRSISLLNCWFLAHVFINCGINYIFRVHSTLSSASSQRPLVRISARARMFVFAILNFSYIVKSICGAPGATSHCRAPHLLSLVKLELFSNISKTEQRTYNPVPELLI